ncbi:MAG: DUF262 domain-containing protein [Bacteroidales bacterium]|nr:DUF262 domain-containing protein [Bacteroidales bacterium]
MASWEKYTVSDIVSEIDEEKFVLPVIQRELVWSEDKMVLLFDSLLKGNSFGGVIVIEEEKDTKSLFAFRAFSKDGNKQASVNKEILSQRQYFVIDGQQRLQTFYIGLKGSYFQKQLYFDLYSDYQNDFDFVFAVDDDKLPKSTKEERPIKDCLWYSAKDLLRKLKDTRDFDNVAEDLSDHFSVDSNEKIKCIKNNVKAFCINILYQESIGIAKVTVNKKYSEIENRQKIVELFRRLNDGGTVLSALDLVASKLKGFDYRMEGFIRKMEDSFKDIGLSPENLIKLIFLLQDNNTKEMASVDVKDAEFAINNQQRIFNTINALRIFLINAKLYDYYNSDSNRSFIPLFFIAYFIFHKSISDVEINSIWNKWETNNVDYKPMKSWLFHSLINGVFRSKGAGWIPYRTGISKLLACIKNYKNQYFPANELMDVYLKHPLVFTTNYTIDNLDKLDSHFLFYLMYDCKRQIRANDIDHIMPYNILKEKQIDDAYINSVKNFQLLDYGTNRGAKKGKSFSEWVNNPNYVKDKKTYIETHLIPSDETLWTENRFEEFASERGQLILYKINSYL